MGRVRSNVEAHAIAGARNAVTVYGVLALLGAAVLWWVHGMFVDAIAGGETASVVEAQAMADVVRIAMYLYLTNGVVFLVSAAGMQRVWLVAWAVPTVLGILTLVTLINEFIDMRSIPVTLGLVVTGWMVSRLLDKDVVRAFTRRRNASEPTQEEWLSPFPVAQPVVAPAPPVPAPAAPPKPFRLLRLIQRERRAEVHLVKHPRVRSRHGVPDGHAQHVPT